MGVANASPPLQPLTSQHVLACISTLGWACCCAAETCDIGEVRALPPWPPPTILMCTSSTDLFDPSSFALHPSIPSLPFTRARPGRAGVAGATFLTFHFMRSASVTLDQALGCAPAPSPHRQAGYNAKHVGSLQHQNTDSLLPLSSLFIPQHPWLSGSLALSLHCFSSWGRGTLAVWWSVAAAALQIPIDEDRGNWP